MAKFSVGEIVIAWNPKNGMDGEDFSSLHGKEVEITDDIEYYIHENEMGIESVHEKHRVWPEE